MTSVAQLQERLDAFYQEMGQLLRDGAVKDLADTQADDLVALLTTGDDPAWTPEAASMIDRMQIPRGEALLQLTANNKRATQIIREYLIPAKRKPGRPPKDRTSA